MLHQEMTIDVLLPEWMKESPIDGVIARVDTRTIDPLRALGVPCVDVRCSRSFTGIPQVETDDRRVSELAFEHLWDRGFRRFAFCGFQFAHYSDARLHFFRELVVDAGCPLSVYETPGTRAHRYQVSKSQEWWTWKQCPPGLLRSRYRLGYSSATTFEDNKS